MDLHPIIDQWPPPHSPLNPRLWYVLSPSTIGNANSNGFVENGAHQDNTTTISSPSGRVGTSATFFPSLGAVYVIGGADPSGAHDDVFEFKLKDDFLWRKIATLTGKFKARYEHAAFTPASYPTCVFVFGGADAGGNTNTLQIYDASTSSWNTPIVSGTPPSPRTYHVSASACRGDRFFVFSGGEAGSQPVGDRQLHYFDASTMTWSVISAKGNPPKPRHGHAVAVVKDRLLVFGGMAGNSFYDDLTFLDLNSNEWKTAKVTKTGWPAARAAHGAVVLVDADGTEKLVVFGGMCSRGALDDLWVLSSTDWKWTRVETQGPPPESRLDFAITVVKPLAVGSSEQCTNTAAAATTTTTTTTTTTASEKGLVGKTEAGTNNLTNNVPFETIVAAEGASNFSFVTDEQKEGGEGGEERVTGGLTESGEMARDGVVDSLAAGLSSSLSLATSGFKTSSAIVEETSSSSSSSMLLIFGGMDTDGEIFDDCLVIGL